MRKKKTLITNKINTTNKCNTYDILNVKSNTIIYNNDIIICVGISVKTIHLKPRAERELQAEPTEGAILSLPTERRCDST